MQQRTISGYTRVQKRTAERLYKEGTPVYLLPVNMHPDNIWQSPFRIHRNDRPEPDNTFYHRVLYFSIYNCQYWQTGLYPAYYIRPNEGGPEA